MPSFFNFGRRTPQPQTQNQPAPPQWAPAPELSHTYGLKDDAPGEEFDAAEAFCASHPVESPRLLESYIVERIRAIGCRAWGLTIPQSTRFQGAIRNPEDAKSGPAVVRVETSPQCKDFCLMSDLPLVAGLYDMQGKQGVYYELTIIEMVDPGLVAIGTACRPYPEYRLPGWNRMSAGLHLDDMRKFFEDPYGGRDYMPNDSYKVVEGDTIGCGYEFQDGVIFFTYNGMRLPDAFTGVYLPSTKQDVYASVGVSGAVKFSVNFGGDYFRWLEGNEWSWRVEGLVGGRLNGAIEGDSGEELPSYREVAGSSFH
ncbi:hypothetical protein H0H93_010825 [Arthromyces matolae]|nr:hypothetical protein H0H93_010825 [Arthromyces matolae]